MIDKWNQCRGTFSPETDNPLGGNVPLLSSDSRWGQLLFNGQYYVKNLKDRLTVINKFPNGLGPANGQRILWPFTNSSLTIRWTRNNMNKKSIKHMQIASIMIRRYILSLKVSKYYYAFSGWSENGQWKARKFADLSLDRVS